MSGINAPKPAGTILERKESTARKPHFCHKCKSEISVKTKYVTLCVSNNPYNNIFLKYHLGCEPKE